MLGAPYTPVALQPPITEENSMADAPPPNGRDDTATIENAARTGDRLQRGRYRYKGQGINEHRITLLGSGRNTTTIEIPDDVYLIDSDQVWHDIRVEGIYFWRGAGAIRNRHTGGNVTNFHEVRHCEFNDYTGAAISHNSTDMPYWKVEYNRFKGHNDSPSTIGVALGGLTDSNAIANNVFLNNQVHIKLGTGGGNAYVENNDFIQWGEGQGRVALWVVPSTRHIGGDGFVVERCKFGIEHGHITDHKVVYADELPGDHFGGRLPDLHHESAGRIQGHTIQNCQVGGMGDTGRPFVYTTTQNLRACNYRDLEFAGTSPSRVVEFLTPPKNYGPGALSSSIGPIYTPAVGHTIEPSNAPGLFYIVDPHQHFDHTRAAPLSIPGGGRGTGLVQLVSAPVDTYHRHPSNVIMTRTTDAIGGGDAATVDLGPAGRGSLWAYAQPGALRAGSPVWVEFDVRAGGDDPTNQLLVVFGLDTASPSGEGTWMQHRVTPAEEWRTYRYLAYAPESSDRALVKFLRGATGEGSTVHIGRARVYHAPEPQPHALVLPDQGVAAGGPGVIFVEGGELKYRGSGGTITTLAVA